MKRDATNTSAFFKFPLKRGLSYWYRKSMRQLPCERSQPSETACYIMVSLPLAFSGTGRESIVRDICIRAGSGNLINNFFLALKATSPRFNRYVTRHRPRTRSCSSLFSLTLAFHLSCRLLIILWLRCLSSFVMIIAEFLSCHPWAWINACRLLFVILAAQTALPL